MNIHEYQGKEILRKYGVTTPKGVPCFSVDEAVKAAETLGGKVWVVKAQIHAGGRGKGTFKEHPAQRGVVLVKSAAEAAENAKRMLGSTLASTFKRVRTRKGKRSRREIKLRAGELI